MPAEFAPQGVTHVNAPHPANFTVIGNHLAQHRELSLTARGLALYIQSVPTGTRVDIKTLSSQFDEGEVRITKALRELEAHGYLRRLRQRRPSKSIVTRTVSYNNPGHGEGRGKGQGRGRNRHTSRSWSREPSRSRAPCRRRNLNRGRDMSRHRRRPTLHPHSPPPLAKTLPSSSSPPPPNPLS
ncbi:MAG TPA: hypothetical protein VIU15_48280, partial [Streptomyces sp.]